MKPNINIIGLNLRQYEFGLQKGKEEKASIKRQGKSLE